MSLPNMVHYTEGGPWHGYHDQDHVTEWMEELRHLLAGSNPKADATSRGLTLAVSYGEIDEP